MASSGKDIIQPYDPSFMLRFSIHSLSMGYLEPVEFSRLGLLAVTFASISSSDGEVRRLGYDCLGRFKICLEVSIPQAIILGLVERHLTHHHKDYIFRILCTCL